MAKHKCPEYEEGAPAWMMTFGDLMSQLLTFFILLLSFSVMDEVKYSVVQASFSESSGLMRGWETPDIPKPIPPERQKFNNEEERMRGIGYELKKQLIEEGKDEAVEVKVTEEGLQLTLKETEGLRFQSAGSVLSAEMKSVLSTIAEKIKELDNKVEISGHTDGTPIRGGRYPSNWELGFARARSVQQYFVSTGISELDTKVASYANSKPIADENVADPQAKLAAQQQNRRVDILLLRKD